MSAILSIEPKFDSDNSDPVPIKFYKDCDGDIVVETVYPNRRFIVAKKDWAAALLLFGEE